MKVFPKEGMRGHTMRCLKNHLKRRAAHLFRAHQEDEWWKAHADAYLRVVDMMEGKITGDGCWFEECICTKKRVPKPTPGLKGILYTHYELEKEAKCQTNPHTA